MPAASSWAGTTIANRARGTPYSGGSDRRERMVSTNRYPLAATTGSAARASNEETILTRMSLFLDGSGEVGSLETADARPARMRPVEQCDDVLEEPLAGKRLLQEGVCTDVLGVRHVFRRTVIAHDEHRDRAQARVSPDVLAQLEAGL